MLLFYLIRRLSSLLDTHFVSMDPRNYSWLEKNDFLLPDKCRRQIPPDLLKICKSCKGCSTKRYVCQKLLGSCTIYYGFGAKCQNIYNIVYKWLIFWKKSFTVCPYPIPLVILNKFHLILYWNRWSRFYLHWITCQFAIMKWN